MSRARNDQVVEAAGDHVTFRDFGCVSTAALKASKDVRRGAVEQYLDEHGHTRIQLRRIQPRLKTEDVALAHQPLVRASTAVGDSDTASGA